MDISGIALQGCTWLRSRTTRHHDSLFCGNPIAAGETQFCQLHATSKPPLSRSFYASLADEGVRFHLSAESIRRLKTNWFLITGGAA